MTKILICREGTSSLFYRVPMSFSARYSLSSCQLDMFSLPCTSKYVSKATAILIRTVYNTREYRANILLERIKQP